MNFQEAEKAYQDLRAQYSAGKLSNTDFEAEVSKLKVQDADGRWWQIGVQSGDWYVHDGQKWTKSHPPAPGGPAGPGVGAGGVEPVDARPLVVAADDVDEREVVTQRKILGVLSEDFEEWQVDASEGFNKYISRY